MTLDILLSVYGNAPYLDVFLQSLREQSCQDYRLLYRFDGTAGADAEVALRNFSGGVEVPGREHMGCTCSYQNLMNASSADYLMFADQDDVWHPEKISKSLEEIKKHERQNGRDVPILVHTDLQVIDCKGKIISKSLRRYQTLCPYKNNLLSLMIQNNVTGCTMIFNRALADLAADFPPEAICHDWYWAMIASAFGKIIYLDMPLIDYRQHAGNVFGAVPRSDFAGKIFQRKQLHDRIAGTQKQANAFLSQFRTMLSSDQIRILDVWGRVLPAQKWYFKRLWLCLKYGFRKNDWLRTIGMWWAL